MNFLVAKTIFYSLAALVRSIVLPLEIKIHIVAPPCNILYIYTFVLLFCLLLHRLAVRISLPFHIFLSSLLTTTTIRGH